MEHAFAELPLAIFSTLASIGAGAFVVLAVAFLGSTVSDSPEKLKKIDRLTIIPLILIAAGFIASVFHLASPLNFINAFNGLGRSPLTNQVTIGLILALLGGVYWIIAITGKLSLGLRKFLVSVIAVVAITFALFIGFAYMIPTIPVWNTPFAPISMLGYSLLGGGLFGLLILQAADALQEAKKGSFKTLSLVLSILGAVAAITGVVGVYMVAGGIVTASAQVSTALPWMIACIVGLVLTLILAALPIVRKPASGVVYLGCLVALCAVFMGRLVFYGLYVTVGF